MTIAGYDLFFLQIYLLGLLRVSFVIFLFCVCTRGFPFIELAQSTNHHANIHIGSHHHSTCHLFIGRREIIYRVMLRVHINGLYYYSLMFGIADRSGRVESDSHGVAFGRKGFKHNRIGSSFLRFIYSFRLFLY